jgi:flagellar biosynthesis anti-sigma factor FlgM
MKVQNQNAVRVDLNQLQAHKQSEAQKTTVAAKLPTEKVSISADAASIKQLGSDAMSAPEVRMNLVNSIKAEVEAGTYQRSAQKVAESMMTASLIESLYSA